MNWNDLEGKRVVVAEPDSRFELLNLVSLLLWSNSHLLHVAFFEIFHNFSVCIVFRVEIGLFVNKVNNEVYASK